MTTQRDLKATTPPLRGTPPQEGNKDAVQRAMESCEASSHAVSDQFRGVTKLIGSGSRLKCEVEHVGGFSTRCVENPLESITIDHASQFAPMSHQYRKDINHGSHS